MSVAILAQALSFISVALPLCRRYGGRPQRNIADAGAAIGGDQRNEKTIYKNFTIKQKAIGIDIETSRHVL